MRWIAACGHKFIEGEEKESAACCNKSAAFAANLAMFPRRHNLAALLYMLGNIDCIMLCYAFVCLYLLNIRSLRRATQHFEFMFQSCCCTHWTNVRCGREMKISHQRDGIPGCLMMMDRFFIFIFTSQTQHFLWLVRLKRQPASMQLFGIGF